MYIFVYDIIFEYSQIRLCIFIKKIKIQVMDKVVAEFLF